MIRTRDGNAVTITRYNGRSNPALFSCLVHTEDGSCCRCVVYRKDLRDDAAGQEILNRIAELERIAEDGEV